MYFYIDFLYSEQGRTIFLEISTTTYYNNMQEWLDELSQYSTREHEIAVQDESWLIDYYPIIFILTKHLTFPQFSGTI